MGKNYFLLLLLVSATNLTIAQRLKTEDFNYATWGQLTDLNGGANVSGGSWITFSGTTKPLQVTAGDLSYPNYFTAPSGPGTHLHLDTSRSNAEDAYSSFQIIKENTIYVSFLLKVSSLDNLAVHGSTSAEFFGCLSSNPNSQPVCRLYIRQGNINKKSEEAASYNLGIAARAYTTTPVNWSDLDLLPNETYLITMAYQIIPGASNDVAKLWVNQPFADMEPAPLVSSTMTAEAGTEPTNIGRFYLRQGYTNKIKAGTPQCDIDAIKISTLWLDGTLPLQLLNISVINNNGYASLSWQTCNEINVNRFEIQKSTDAINFSTIATVAAKNALCATTYNYADAKALSGTAYYRIQTVDNDGKKTYSAIASINGKASLSLNIFPNPVTNNLVLSHPQAGNNAYVQIISLNGKDILRQALQPGSIQTSVDVSTFIKGNYIVVYINDNTKQSIKFVKQ